MLRKFKNKTKLLSLCILLIIVIHMLSTTGNKQRAWGSKIKCYLLLIGTHAPLSNFSWTSGKKGHVWKKLQQMQHGFSTLDSLLPIAAGYYSTLEYFDFSWINLMTNDNHKITSARFKFNAKFVNEIPAKRFLKADIILVLIYSVAYVQILIGNVSSIIIFSNWNRSILSI